MAGHSQFKNIMYRKGAQDKKRAKLFTKMNKEITVAVREGGPEPESNPRLRQAVATALYNNMPKTNIERAIKKASGAESGGTYEEIRYEGYGPGGVAVIADCLTDNRNRTAGDVRAIFNKYGGKMGEQNTAAVMFERVGRVVFGDDVTDMDTLFEAAAEAGAEDVEHQPAPEDGESETGSFEVVCEAGAFSQVREALREQFGDPREGRLGWRPISTQPVDEADAQTLFKLLNALEDHDDVQQVSSNFEVSGEVMRRLTA